MSFPKTIDVSALRGRRLREWRGRCAMVFQQFNLVPRLPVLTNVLIGRIGYRATLPSLLGMFSDDGPGAHPAGAGAARHGDPCAAPRRCPVGRPAAAHRHRPRPGAGAAHPARRRADRLARPAQRHDRHGCAAPHQQGGRHYRHLQPAPSADGAGLLRSDHWHAQGHDRVRRQAVGTHRFARRARSTPSAPAATRKWPWPSVRRRPRRATKSKKTKTRERDDHEEEMCGHRGALAGMASGDDRGDGSRPGDRPTISSAAGRRNTRR